MSTKPKLTLSINPTYFCNFDCHFCYLTPEQLNNRKNMNLEVLKKRILEIEEFFEIDCIDLYGGEIALLDEGYLNNIADLFDLTVVDFNAITNLSVTNNFFSRKDISVSVSWEDDIRRKSQVVLDNMKNLGREINLLMLAGPEVLEWNDSKIDRIVQEINSIENIVSLEIKPYSTNQANSLELKFTCFESFVKKVLAKEKNFIFVNEENLKAIKSGSSNSFSDDHIYITPEGEFAVLDFDELDNELFLPIKNIKEYIRWSNNEKVKVISNSFCNKCEYLGSCLSEHLRDVKSLDDSCNGFYNLIKWYECR